MFTHSQIWSAIDLLAKRNGLSTSGLAKLAGLDPTAFNKSKRKSPEGKPRWPSTESLAKILDVTGASMHELTGVIHSLQSGLSTEEIEDGGQNIDLQSPPSIPMINLDQIGQDDFFDEQGKPSGTGWDEVCLPSLSGHGQGLYALEINATIIQNSVAGFCREGDTLIIAPSSDLRRGDRIIARTIAGEIIIHEFLRQTNTKIELAPIKGTGSKDKKAKNRIFLPRDISWLARIMWVSQ